MVIPKIQKFKNSYKTKYTKIKTQARNVSTSSSFLFSFLRLEVIMLSLSGGISESRTLFFLFYYSFYGQTSIGSYDLMITVGVRNSTKEGEKKKR